MTNRRAILIQNFDLARMPHALRNHQAVDAVRGEILHVAIEQARTLAVENAVAIANYCANRRARSSQCALADSLRQRPKIGMGVAVRRARLKLVRSRKLANRDLVLIGMARPRAVHQRIGFVLFVFRKDLQRSRIQLCVFAAGVKRGHSTDCEHPVFMANVRHEIAQILEERHIVRNRVAVGKNPHRIFQIEVDQAGHVIPTPEVQSQDVVAQIPGKFFHLKCQRMRFHQRHAFDGIRWPALQPRNHLEKIAPPQRLRSEEHTSELQSQFHLVCRLLLEKKKKKKKRKKKKKKKNKKKKKKK